MPELRFLVEYEDQEGRHSEHVPLKEYDKWLIERMFEGGFKIVSANLIADNEKCLSKV